MRLEDLQRTVAEASKVFILTDEEVAMFWLPELKHWLKCPQAIEIVIKSGEEHKDMKTVQQIWKKLMRHQADRNALLLNLGGGMVTDVGGFAVSCYQRGIRFVNVPTTLLAMVDAAFGGKTGVDFGGCKNQVGTFAQPIEVLVHPVFLSTLSERQLLSGLSEMVKYGFIADKHLLTVTPNNYEQYILRAVKIKMDIVERDFKEQGERKVLNFGHTLGHALESVSLAKSLPITHGEAVAMGMWCALWLSVRLCGLESSVLDAYQPTLKTLLSEAEWAFGEGDVEEVVGMLGHDKKNRDGQAMFVLLESIGHPLYDQQVPGDLVRESYVELIRMLDGL